MTVLAEGLDPAAGALADWSYALPELFPPERPWIANPGCYATAVLLALAPLADVIEPAGVVVDAKSGVSGAGRTLKASSHATAVLENVSPYKVGSHQHAPEIAQALGFPVCFVPHLLPVKRGLLATCYVTATADLRDALEGAYAAAPAVTVLPEGLTPELSRVQGTDGAEIGVFTDRSTGTGIVVCALDNLGKGAAGQAVQNANLALGLPETRAPARRGARMSVAPCGSLPRGKPCFPREPPSLFCGGTSKFPRTPKAHRPRIGHSRRVSPPRASTRASGARGSTWPSSARPSPPSARRCSPSTRCRPRRSSSRRSISSRPSRRRS